MLYVFRRKEGLEDSCSKQGCKVDENHVEGV